MSKKKAKKPVHDIDEIVKYLTGTSLMIEAALKYFNIDKKYLDEIQIQVNQHILQCEVCGDWDEAGELINDHCELCWADAPENPENDLP